MASKKTISFRLKNIKQIPKIYAIQVMTISNLSHVGRCVSGTYPNKHVQYPCVPLIDFNRFWWYPSVTKSMTKHETRSTPRPDLGWFQKMLVSLWMFLVGRCMHLGWFPIPPLTPIPPLPHPTDLHNHTNPETAIAYKPLILWGSRWSVLFLAWYRRFVVSFDICFCVLKMPYFTWVHYLLHTMFNRPLLFHSNS